eukprot:COSAG02_NODE_8023_length_2743_cov_1.909228_2_plen_148_part_00
MHDANPAGGPRARSEQCPGHPRGNVLRRTGCIRCMLTVTRQCVRVCAGARRGSRAVRARGAQRGVLVGAQLLAGLDAAAPGRGCGVSRYCCSPWLVRHHCPLQRQRCPIEEKYHTLPALLPTSSGTSTGAGTSNRFTRNRFTRNACR